MSLTKQTIDLLLTEGVNNKTDDRLTLNSSLKALENRVFNKFGRLDKRKGLDILSNEDFDNTSISDMSAISKFGEDEVVLFADSSVYSYSPNVDLWKYKDEALSAQVKLTPIVDGPTQQNDIDSCHTSGITLYTWVDATTSDIMAAVYDTTSKTVLSTTYTISTTGDSPRCVAIGNSLWVLYCDGTALKYAFVSASNPTTVSTGTLSTSYENVHSDHIFDITNIGSVGYVFYKGTTAATVQWLNFNTAGDILVGGTLTATVTTCLGVNSFEATDGFSYVALGYRESASLVKGAIYTQSMTVKKAISTIDSTASLTITAITMAYSSETDKVEFLYESAASPTYNSIVSTNTIGLTSGTIGTSAVFLRSVGLASKAFSYLGNVYINLLHESALQATVFTVKSSTKGIVCTFARGRAGSLSTIWAPPSVSSLTDNTFEFAMQLKGVIRSENATLFSLLGIANAIVDFEGPYIYNSVTINNNMLAVGGNVLSYDGTWMVESGFHLFPEGVAQTATATSGGYMSDGAFQYVALYSWVDSKGNRHKSAPSIPISYTTAGGGSTQTVTITVPTLRLTQKTGDRGECTIELYRTEASGTIFYKVTSIASPTFNDITVDSVAIVDTLADATIISNEILYTTGGVLDNIAPPSANTITTHNNRVFVAGLEDGNEIRYSKIVRKGEAPSFNEGLSIQCDPVGGDIIVLASMDGRLIIFKNNSIYQQIGDGPSDTGEGATFGEPELISSDVGCTDGNSVVLYPDGLLFKSAKGIYLLSRTNEVSYIGSNVEDFNSESVTSAVLSYDTNEVRFSTNGGNILVYNYFFKQWSVFTGNDVTDALIYNDKYTLITSDNTVLQESSTSYKDQEAYVNSKISTGWIRVGGIQNFQRVYRVSILGKLNTQHFLKVSIYTDYSDTLVQERIFDVSAIMSQEEGFYGDGIYGDGIYGGTDNGVYQFQVHMKQQKCQAMRVVVEDIYDNSFDDNTGQGADIVGVTLEIGTKKGLNKLVGNKVR